MDKNTTTMEKLVKIDGLINKAIDEWNKGEPDKAAYNTSLREARRLIFEAYYIETGTQHGDR